MLKCEPSPLDPLVESLQRAVADVPERPPMSLSVLSRRLAEAVGASRGEGRRPVGGAVPAALSQSLVVLGGRAWHVVAFRAPMPAWGVVGLFQVAHCALALRQLSAAEVNVKLSSLEAVPKNPLLVFLDSVYGY